MAWVQIDYVTYGPQGRIPKTRHIVVPLKFPSSDDSKRWRPAANSDVLPIRTHLLTELDDPVEVVRRYVVPPRSTWRCRDDRRVAPGHHAGPLHSP